MSALIAVDRCDRVAQSVAQSKAQEALRVGDPRRRGAATDRKAIVIGR